VDAHCYGGPLHWLSAFHEFFSAVFFIFFALQNVAVLTGGRIDTGIQKLVSRYNKCLNSGGDYIEK
jgi:hypothetical protein